MHNSAHTCEIIALYGVCATRMPKHLVNIDTVVQYINEYRTWREDDYVEIHPCTV